MLTKNATQTKQLGARLAKRLRGGEILALYGELGAGKTTLVQGLARGLGIKKWVTSPTFILLNVFKISHRGRIKYFIHVDAYRLKQASEALEIGLSDYLGRPDTVVVIEWAEKLEEVLKNYKVKKIKLKTLSAAKRVLIL